MSERIALRTATQRDRERIRTWVRRPEVANAMGSGRCDDPVPPDDGGQVFMMIRRRDDEPIGYIELRDMKHGRRAAELLMCIGDPADRGRGYGPEALEELKHVLPHVGLDAVYLRVFTDNDVAVRCYEKAGFTKTAVQEGTLRRDAPSKYLMEYWV